MAHPMSKWVDTVCCLWLALAWTKNLAPEMAAGGADERPLIAYDEAEIPRWVTGNQSRLRPTIGLCPHGPEAS